MGRRRDSSPRRSGGRGGRFDLSRLIIGVLVVVVVAAAGLPAGALVDDPDVDTAAAYRYEVDPEAGEVEVTIEFQFTADKPNRTTDTGFYQYYFDGTVLAVPADVRDLSVTDGSGRELSVEIDDSVAGIDQLLIDFRSNVFYRQTAEVVIRFTLPGGSARGDELTRVNPAYASFEAWVDPRLEEATVTVVAPVGFVDRSTGSDPFERGPARSGDDGVEVVFEVGGIDPEDYWSAVSLARDAELVRQDIEIGEIDFELQAWPGDEVWSRFVVDNLERGLPVLVDEVGLPWPVDGDLTIIESYTPYLNGYAGWYDLNTDEIEIGDELDTHVMFHEVSHVWFNGELFNQRWITEGLADEFGAEVVEAVGEQRPTPPAIRRNDAAAEPLNRWRVGTDDVDLERWSYGASWTVTEALADEVGLEVLAEAVRAAADDEIAYLGDAAPEVWDRTDDWRRYLDLLENRGAVTDAAVTDLFTQWVLTESEADELEERAASRDRYADLVATGGDWAPPLAVRTAMGRWWFAEADQLMVDAEAVLDQRTAAGEVLDDLSALLPDGATVSIPADLEAAYEGADDDLVATADLGADILESAEGLRGAGRAIEAATGPLERLGAIGSDHRADLAVAAARFSGGDLAGADRAVADLDGEVSSLRRDGLRRVGAAVVIGVLIGVVVWWLRRRRRHRRQRPVAGEHEPTPPQLSAGSGREPGVGEPLQLPASTGAATAPRPEPGKPGD